MLGIDNSRHKSTTASILAEALRNSILDGSLKSGQPLRQDVIASRHKVSKIPVREALVQLQSEGLVSFQPSRGAIVTTLTPEQAEEIYLMRIALETVALRKAISNLSERDFLSAEHLLTLIDADADWKSWGNLNWQFHSTLYQPANLPYVMNTLRILFVNVSRYFIVYEAMLYRERSQAEHRDIVMACREGNIDTACFYLENHLRTTARNLVDYLKAHRSD